MYSLSLSHTGLLHCLCNKAIYQPPVLWEYPWSWVLPRLHWNHCLGWSVSCLSTWVLGLLWLFQAGIYQGALGWGTLGGVWVQITELA